MRQISRVKVTPEMAMRKHAELVQEHRRRKQQARFSTMMSVMFFLILLGMLAWAIPSSIDGMYKSQYTNVDK